MLNLPPSSCLRLLLNTHLDAVPTILHIFKGFLTNEINYIIGGNYREFSEPAIRKTTRYVCNTIWNTLIIVEQYDPTYFESGRYWSDLRTWVPQATGEERRILRLYSGFAYKTWDNYCAGLNEQEAANYAIDAISNAISPTVPELAEEACAEVAGKVRGSVKSFLGKELEPFVLEHILRDHLKYPPSGEATENEPFYILKDKKCERQADAMVLHPAMDIAVAIDITFTCRGNSEIVMDKCKRYNDELISHNGTQYTDIRTIILANSTTPRAIAYGQKLGVPIIELENWVTDLSITLREWMDN